MHLNLNLIFEPIWRDKWTATSSYYIFAYFRGSILAFLNPKKVWFKAKIDIFVDVNQLRAMYTVWFAKKKKTLKNQIPTLSNWRNYRFLFWLPKWPITAKLFDKFCSTYASIINSQGQCNQWAKYNSVFRQSIFSILYAFASFFHWDVCLNAVYRTWKDKMVMVAQPNALAICLLK